PWWCCSSSAPSRSATPRASAPISPHPSSASGNGSTSGCSCCGWSCSRSASSRAAPSVSDARSYDETAGARGTAPRPRSARRALPARRRDDDGGLHVGGALHADAPPEREHDRAGDPEPQAEAADAPPRRRALEASEDPLAVLWTDAGAVVADRQGHGRGRGG